MSEIGVFSVPYFPVFGLKTEIYTKLCKSINLRLLSEVYLEPSRTSMIERFCENS